MPQTNNTLTEKILSKINSGEIKAKPKIFFLVKTIGFIVLSIFSFLIAIFTASFVAFALPLGGPSLLLTILGFTVLISVMLNIFLAKKFPSFYKKPLIFNLLIFIILTLLASLLILKTPLHSKMLELSKQKDIPIVSPLYKHGCGCNAQKTCGCTKANGQCNMNMK
ncbi:MAG: hypothetical protein PHY72_00695 [Candidatus Pacebacteria bacterium]|nr:hypothetical protein [Candidatus Paceibacterota bacterium]